MPEPPTPIIHPTATRSERFQRTNGMPAQPPAAPPPPKPKLKKLRLALVIAGLSLLAFISTVFGMLMAVASDLPSLENRAQYDRAENSLLFADTPGCMDLDKDTACQEIAKLTGNQNRILVGEGEISPNVKNAVIAIEDRRFYSHKGVDYTGIGRGLVSGVFQR
jgi:penicillin-binding protein 1A